MKTVVFDIETVGCDFAELDAFSQDYFCRFSEREEISRVEDSLSFYPLTAEVVAICLMDADNQEGAVYFQEQGMGLKKYQAGSIHFYPCDERGILMHFWKQLDRYDRFVTFNGRMFDCPFIMIRSAVHRLRCARNLLPYRYSVQEHVDLADQLSFYGCFSRRFPLHMWCRAFGIARPKDQGVSGLDVGHLFAKQQYRSIAEYCVRDVDATRMLYDCWRGSLSFKGE